MQRHHVVVEKVLPYKRRRTLRDEIKETMTLMLIAFIFLMVQIIGVYIIFADQF